MPFGGSLSYGSFQRDSAEAYFLRISKSRCGMPARRAPDRLACFAHSSSGFLSRFACVRLPRTGATQQFGGSHGAATASITMSRWASSTFSGPFRRCWVAGIVSFHSHRNLQDLNLRSLPLSVKRRIPPRPRLHMSPSFRGVILHWWPVIPPVGPLRATPSGVSVRYYLIRRFFLGLDVACTWISSQPTLVPHGGCDPPARISGLMRSCGIFRRYCRHGRGRVRRGKRSMEYAFILGRMCTCLLYIFFASFFIIPQYLVFVNRIIDFYINILCFQELSNALRTISCI